MAKVIEWSKQQRIEWDEWVGTRPEIIQDLCRRFPLYNLYRLKSTGQKVTLYSYSEDGTITVNVTEEYNAIMFNRRVFGIKPEDIEECELPPLQTPAHGNTGLTLAKLLKAKEILDENALRNGAKRKESDGYKDN